MRSQVFIASPPPGDYIIHVRAPFLFTGARPQTYALVVLGHFQGTLDSPFNPATTNSSAASDGTGEGSKPPAT
jgi:hypothetical protein